MHPFDDMQFDQDDHADVALLVAGVREFPSEEFALELDARVARRFAPAASAGERNGRRRRAWRRSPRWAVGAVGTAFALVAGVVAAVVISGAGSGGSDGLLAEHAARNVPSSTYSAAGSTGTAGSSPAAGSSGSVVTSSVGQPRMGSSLNVTAAVPSVPGAKQIRSAQITLSTPNGHVNQVAQEIIDVVASQHGTVQSSHVTAATRTSGGGYASFTLSIPTGNLQTAMTQLSRLHFAALTSRSDNSQNVSSRYGNDQQKLADAQALRTSLLKQLQTADSETAIDSIEAQIKTAENQIANWQSALHTLQHRISYSDVTVQINEGGLPVVPVARSAGFTFARATHDALRVLVVSAGIAVIVLAALIPLTLVVALLMWLWLGFGRRRREQALDAS